IFLDKYPKDTPIKNRLEKIRVQFLFDHPFLSVLALSIPHKYQNNPHMLFETDGVSIRVDESKMLGYDDARLKYLYAHVLLHILLKHPFRMKDRDKPTWNRSCDIVIGLLLRDFQRVGQADEEAMVIESFRDKSVEEVYHALYRESDEGEGQQSEENPTEQKMDIIEHEGDTQVAEEELDALIIQAMGAARKQGNIPASLLEMFDEITKPSIDLHTLLHTYMSESFFDKESDFSHPNRRFIHQGLYLPGYRYDRNRLSFFIFLDRSMSITGDVFSRFLGIIDSIVRLSHDFEVSVIPFDERVYSEEKKSYDAQGILPQIEFAKGNGGTQFSPVLEFLNSHAGEKNLAVILSDGYFTVDKAPAMQTLFLLSEKQNLKRFERYGDVVYFDLS
ncbi:VWA-like domain-containing protein, partial [Sulfuricurvum sp. RIFOXYD2_FULL_44_160]|uniref:vWA domain-containing protein n=2 Tax=unclassified Sulfuricurvum TaxID=2632390 RepID=UPI000AC9201E